MGDGDPARHLQRNQILVPLGLDFITSNKKAQLYNMVCSTSSSGLPELVGIFFRGLVDLQLITRQRNYTTCGLNEACGNGGIV